MLRLAAAAALAAFAASTSAAEDWRTPDPENLLVIETRYGRTVVELAPDFAPKHVERMRALVRAKFYDGQSFYRVIDGFVAQGGIGEGDDKKLEAWPPLAREFERPVGDLPFRPTGSPDLFAPQTGWTHGFPAGRDPQAGLTWLAHCPGAFAFARDDEPDTAATEFYIVIGQSPRRLDRIMAVAGRVLTGLDKIQKLNRGDPEIESGVIQDESQRDAIISMRIAADLPPEQRPHLEVMDVHGEAFATRLEERRVPASPFFFKKPPPILEVCNVAVPVREVGEMTVRP